MTDTAIEPATLISAGELISIDIVFAEAILTIARILTERYADRRTPIAIPIPKADRFSNAIAVCGRGGSDCDDVDLTKGALEESGLVRNIAAGNGYTQGIAAVDLVKGGAASGSFESCTDRAIERAVIQAIDHGVCR